MRNGGRNLIRYSALALCWFITVFAYAQIPNFRTFTVEDGLPQQTIYTIHQSESSGELWFGTQAGVARFDGKRFINYNQSNGLNGNHISKIYPTKNGKLWLGYRFSGLSLFDPVLGASKSNNAQFPKLNSRVMDIMAHDTELWVGSESDGLHYSLNATAAQVSDVMHVVQMDEFKIEKVSSFADREKEVLIGTNMGLAVYDRQSDKFRLEMIGRNILKVIPLADDKYMLISPYEIITVHYVDGKVAEEQVKVAGIDFKKCEMSDAALMEDGAVWISCSIGVIRYQQETFKYLRKPQGIPEDMESTIKQDREGTIWVGTSGFGAYQYKGEDFVLYNSALGITNDIIRAIIPEDRSFWTGTDGGLFYLTFKDNHYSIPDATKEFNVASGHLPNNMITDVLKDRANDIWVVTRGGVAHFTSDGKKLAVPDALKNMKSGRSIVQHSGGDIWIASLADGIFKLDRQGKLTNYLAEDGLGSKSFWQVIEGPDETLWFGGNENGLVTYKNGEFKQITSNEGLPNNRPGSMSFDENGNLWIGSIGGGVIVKEGDKYTSYTTNEGVGSNNPYFVQCDGAGSVWVGTNTGIDRIDIDSRTIKHFGKGKGFSGVETNQNAVSTGVGNELWFGSVKGLFKCDPRLLDKEQTKPIIKMTGLRVFLRNEAFGQSTFSYKESHLTFDYNAANFYDPNNLKYKFRLRPFEEEYNPLTSTNFATYSNVAPGSYTFEVVAVNSDGVESGVVSYDLEIEPPFWKEIWFIVLSVVLGVLLFLGIMKVRTNSLIARKEELEQKVDERTEELQAEKAKVEEVNKEVLHQKKMVDMKNKDITESIEYARNIQSSMLAAPQDLGKLFADAFIYYKPRDIVSGDFYWFGEFDDHVVVAAADCTGHGVPGAFMSMLGNELLNQIVGNKMMNNPGEALTALDSKVYKTLSRNSSYNAMKDGMDISLCAIDRKSYTLEFGGACRPLIIISDGELELIKGQSISIGGGNQSAEFKTVTRQLKKGDRVYLYSDGFVDQFGGAKGKKFMSKRFKQLLIDIQNESMSSQHDQLNKAFIDWMGKQDQVDDVMVIGVEL